MSAILTPPTTLTLAPPVPAPAPIPAPTPPAPYTPELFRFTVAEYCKLGDVGILSPESRVELINGLIVRKPMQNSPHADAVRALQDEFASHLGSDWMCQSQLPIRLDDSSPEPDLTVLRRPRTRYVGRPPEPADIGMVIEVADTSVRYDTVEKAAMYARNGLPVYWVIHVTDRRIEVYSQPANGEYATRADYTADQAVPIVLDGQTVATINVSDALQ